MTDHTDRAHDALRAAAANMHLPHAKDGRTVELAALTSIAYELRALRATFEDEPAASDPSERPAAGVYTNAERTVCVEIDKHGELAVILRDHPGDLWGPPIALPRERDDQ